MHDNLQQIHPDKSNEREISYENNCKVISMDWKSDNRRVVYIQNKSRSITYYQSINRSITYFKEYKRTEKNS
jgi:hypothetical protein